MEYESQIYRKDIYLRQSLCLCAGGRQRRDQRLGWRDPVQEETVGSCDASIVRYELVSATILTGLRYDDDNIPPSPNRQMAGAVLPVAWDRAGSGYLATFNIMLLDRAGNQSSKVPFIFDCSR